MRDKTITSSDRALGPPLRRWPEFCGATRPTCRSTSARHRIRGSFGCLRSLGAEPIHYGDGLAERVRAAAPDGIIAAADLFGAEAAYEALHLGAPAERVSTIAARDPNLSAKAVGGIDAEPGTLQHIAKLIAAGRLTVPVAAQYPIEQIRAAVTSQATRHARGKVVITV